METSVKGIHNHEIGKVLHATKIVFGDKVTLTADHKIITLTCFERDDFIKAQWYIRGIIIGTIK